MSQLIKSIGSEKNELGVNVVLVSRVIYYPNEASSRDGTRQVFVCFTTGTPMASNVTNTHTHTHFILFFNCLSHILSRLVRMTNTNSKRQCGSLTLLPLCNHKAKDTHTTLVKIPNTCGTNTHTIT